MKKIDDGHTGLTNIWPESSPDNVGKVMLLCCRDNDVLSSRIHRQLFAALPRCVYPCGVCMSVCVHVYVCGWYVVDMCVTWYTLHT